MKLAFWTHSLPYSSGPVTDWVLFPGMHIIVVAYILLQLLDLLIFICYYKALDNQMYAAVWLEMRLLAMYRGLTLHWCHHGKQGLLGDKNV